jgi:hypothetical protein
LTFQREAEPALQTPDYQQSWLSSAKWDTALIIGPAIISSVSVIIFREQIQAVETLPLWAWVCFILLVDVAHVYATLFRTYFEPSALRKNYSLLVGIPASCWIVGSLLYSIDALLFWRVLAYLAVFHFIRQQFGFVVLYSRKDPPVASAWRGLDSAILYMATLYPLIFWHTHMPRNFCWFVPGDFLESIPQCFVSFGLFIYQFLAVSYLIKEFIVFARSGFFNVPRNLLIASTALSWWVSIISLNSDLAFTMINVVSHGIPYMALIWLTNKNIGREQITNSQASSSTKSIECQVSPESSNWSNFGKLLMRLARQNVFCFLFFLIFLAYLEEGLWDGFIWREHSHLFSLFSSLPLISDAAVLSIIIPLLALPQSTHYVLDGFIWRVKDKSSVWSI